MFVMASKYQESQAQCQQLESTVNALERRIAELESTNQGLERQVDELQRATSTSTENPVLSCMLDCLAQVEGIRQTVLQSHENIAAKTETVASLNDLFGTSSQSLNEIVSSMSGMGSKMEGMTTSISGLSETADSINTFVSTITSISDQTNLLALNAAIEAARAGDAGRGFSVVADEVRSLANETNKSASEVAELVSNIISSTKDAVGSVTDIKDTNDQLSNGVDELNRHYSDIVSCCDTMKSTISESSHRTFMQTVKLDHIVWKADVYAVVVGQSHKSVDDFADHTNCRLGKWLASEASKFTSQSSVREIDKPHSEVHKHGVAALKAFKAGDEASGQRYLVAMEQASQRVLSLIDEIANLEVA